MAKRTPLYGLYGALGGRTIDFNGWEMPVSFSSGILAEHTAVRERAGLFDVSHMGEVELSGPGAGACLQRLATNDVDRLRTGRALYTPFCHPDGGTIDDVLIYRLADERYLVVANAGNTEKDLAWIAEHARGARVVDRSDELALLALQGPCAADLLQEVSEPFVAGLARYAFLPNVTVCGKSCLVSRTGYTGEDGFEIYAASEDAAAVFEGLLEAGAPCGLLPAGLGARDTLRLEACLPLYGHELTDDITPIEAGLSAFVKFGKGEFIGREALWRQTNEGTSRRIAGFMLQGRGVPRAGYLVSADGASVGYVTSATLSPTLKQGIGLALVRSEYARTGTPLVVDIRGRAAPATVVRTPFYRRDCK